MNAGNDFDIALISVKNLYRDLELAKVDWLDGKENLASDKVDRLLACLEMEIIPRLRRISCRTYEDFLANEKWDVYLNNVTPPKFEKR